ncbi:thaumatin-like protein 1b [Lotus japonicus]|uniref:thaumatin-like protein 1b n=1 Tax=Lotus japonicus TaxID=34305 RepID=UPI00258A11B7|nr:thaumatin-like protein 1b [Lotus japonicus]
MAESVKCMAEGVKVVKDFYNDSRGIADELMKFEDLTPKERNKAGRVSCDASATFFLENKCSHTIWPALSLNISDAEECNIPLEPGFVSLLKIDAPWFGSIWARTLCSTPAPGYFSCETGDCGGTGTIACSRPEPIYPVTELIFEINNDSAVSYDLSLVHGHNAMVSIKPNGGTLVGHESGPCPMVQCNNDLSSVCPSHLKAYHKYFEYVGCMNSCDVIDHDLKYCYARGIASSPDEYMKMNKQLCPDAATYLGDKSRLVYQCKGAQSYLITFCPGS